jgi:hypothetical protein
MKFYVVIQEAPEAQAHVEEVEGKAEKARLVRQVRKEGGRAVPFLIRAYAEFSQRSLTLSA